MEIFEYDYHEAVLSITIVTQRPDAAPSNVLVAGTLFDDYAASTLLLLREFRRALDPYLPYYSVRKCQPAGDSRDVDLQLNQDIFRQHFSLGIALLDTAWTADEKIVFAFSRNLAKAVKDLFAAKNLPNLFIQGDGTTLGDSYIQIVVNLGAASNIGAWVIPDTIADS